MDFKLRCPYCANDIEAILNDNMQCKCEKCNNTIQIELEYNNKCINCHNSCCKNKHK